MYISMQLITFVENSKQEENIFYEINFEGRSDLTVTRAELSDHT